MTIDHSYGAVASWCGCLPISSDRDRREDTMEIARLLRTIADVLAKEGLLRATTMELDGWFDISTHRATGAPSMTCILGSTEEIVSACAQALESHEEKGLGARELAVHGKGRVVGGEMDHDEDDLVWISGALTGAYSIGIHTQSDAWMTHALDGTPQPATYAANAPRLERALTMICSELGIILEAERVTDFALVEGFRVNNFTGGHGEVIVPSRLLGVPSLAAGARQRRGVADE